MTFSLENLGCNSGYLSPKAIKQLGYSFIETSLGKLQPYPQMVRKILHDLDEAKQFNMNYAIHLPVFLSEQWRKQYDFYDALFLDPKPEIREMAFQMLETNLEMLSEHYKPIYYVIHFPGIYSAEIEYLEDFSELLQSTLDRLEAISVKFDCILALEYFATNARFADYRDWLAALEPYTKLKPLLDTGHLYFSCYKNGFSYDEVLKGLAPHCVGFHLWNVKGEGYYDKSEYYQKYHHIIPHLEQHRDEGWAFDPEVVLPYLASFNKPMLVEAGQRYQGETYFLEGLSQIVDLLRKCT